MKVRLINQKITEDYGKNLLMARGVQEVDSFLKPTFEHLSDFFCLNNIREGILAIDEAIKGNSKIALIVDCDVDGYTSSAILYQYLKRLAPELRIDYYLHNGKQHGLEDHWEHLFCEGYDLIIIPDAGSNDSPYIRKLDCKTLVIDHHILEDSDIDDNLILINNQTSKNYKNKDLSGAGMVYQFCRALDWAYGKNWANDYIDLAALGICGDMMSGLEIENQFIWKYGFSHINNLFFKILLEKQDYSMGGKVTPITVAFYIVPLINAMIRVGTMGEKERLFLAFVDGDRLVPCNKRGAKGTMERVAIESARECTNARTRQNKMRDEAVARLECKIFKHDLLENKVLFIRLDNEDNFPSVLNGLVCMQLSAKYKRPTIVARLNEQGYIRGSARGVNDSELVSFKDYLNSTGLFEYTVGHDNAFGISLSNAVLDRFHEKANEQLSNYDFGENTYDVNFQRIASDKDLECMILDLAQYEDVWSQQNNEPLIYITDINITKKDIQVIGKNSDTLKFIKNGITYIKFHAKDLISELQDMDEIKMNVVAKPNLNEWMGTVSPQLFIEAYEVEDGKYSF